MSLYLEVQQKAEEESTELYGRARLPNAQYRKDLPYVKANMREVMCLNPVAPLGEHQYC